MITHGTDIEETAYFLNLSSSPQARCADRVHASLTARPPTDRSASTTQWPWPPTDAAGRGFVVVNDWIHRASSHQTNTTAVQTVARFRV